MTFNEERIPDFLEKFDQVKSKIRSFEGCERLVLLRDINEPTIFFTYSFWKDQAALDNYRSSEFFGETWKFTKSLFSEKPEAWSVNQEVILT